MFFFEENEEGKCDKKKTNEIKKNQQSDFKTTEIKVTCSRDLPTSSVLVYESN